MSHKMVIGITGTLGAGKGTVVDVLVGSYGFRHFSVRGYLEQQLAARNLESNRDNMTVVANEIRSAHGASYIIEQLYKQAKASGSNSVIESVRTTGEIQFLETLPRFALLAVNAPPELRYQRIRQRGSSTDSVSYEKFLADEQRESESEDADKQNLTKCIALADVLIINDGTRTALGTHILRAMQQLFDRMRPVENLSDPTTPMLDAIMRDGMGVR
jgi:dephospho-CoA kinase